MSELSNLIYEIKGDRSIRQMSKDTGVSASYLTGILQGKHTPSLKVLSKLTDPNSHPQKNISASMLSEVSVGRTLCDDYDEDLETRIDNVTKLLMQCAEELNEISKIRASRHLKKIEEEKKKISEKYNMKG